MEGAVIPTVKTRELRHQEPKVNSWHVAEPLPHLPASESTLLAPLGMAPEGQHYRGHISLHFLSLSQSKRAFLSVLAYLTFTMLHGLEQGACVILGPVNRCGN